MKSINLQFPVEIDCPFCNGTGQIEIEHYYLYGPRVSCWVHKEICSECEGTGSIEIHSYEEFQELSEEFPEIEAIFEEENEPNETDIDTDDDIDKIEF